MYLYMYVSYRIDIILLTHNVLTTQMLCNDVGSKVFGRHVFAGD